MNAFISKYFKYGVHKVLVVNMSITTTNTKIYGWRPFCLRVLHEWVFKRVSGMFIYLELCVYNNQSEVCVYNNQSEVCVYNNQSVRGMCYNNQSEVCVL